MVGKGASMSNRWPLLNARLCPPYELLQRHNQVLVLIHLGRLAGVDHRRAVELVEDCRTFERYPDADAFALIDRAVDIRAVHAHAPRLALRVVERCAGALEL